MMHHRGRPLTRRQEMEARKQHGMAMNAVLEELKLVQAAEKAAVVAGSPAQQRARQWQSESGRRPAPAELAKVAASHMNTPVVEENLISFVETGERGAGTAPPQAVGKVPGANDVAAAKEQHSRAAAHEVLTTPHVRRSVYGRESRGAVLEGQFDDYADAGGARKQPISPAPHEVLTQTDVRRSVHAVQSSSPHGGGRTEDQGQGPSLEVGGLGLHRPSLGDPLGS